MLPASDRRSGAAKHRNLVATSDQSRFLPRRVGRQHFVNGPGEEDPWGRRMSFSLNKARRKNRGRGAEFMVPVRLSSSVCVVGFFFFRFFTIKIAECQVCKVLLRLIFLTKSSIKFWSHFLGTEAFFFTLLAYLENIPGPDKITSRTDPLPMRQKFFCHMRRIFYLTHLAPHVSGSFGTYPKDIEVPEKIVYYGKQDRPAEKCGSKASSVIKSVTLVRKDFSSPAWS